MKELDLKSGTAKAGGKRIKSVRMREDVQFFGLHGSQIAQDQSGHVKLEWDPTKGGGVVVVTSSTCPGDERWLFPGGIQSIGWTAE